MKNQRRQRRARRFILFTLAFFLFLGILLLVLERPLLRHFALPALEKAAGEALGLSVKVADVRLEGLQSIAVVGLDAIGPAPRTGIQRLSIDRTAVAFSLPGLLWGRKDWLRRVDIEGPRVEIDLDREPLLPSLGKKASSGRVEASPVHLPRVEVSRGELEIRTGDRKARLHGVEGSLNGLELLMRVREADGQWQTPRLEALGFPLILGARLAEGSNPFREIEVNRLSLGGKSIVEVVRVDLSTPGVVRFSGDLPGWGVVVPSGKLEANTLDIDVRARGAPIHSIVSLFTDWPSPRGHGTGDFHLVLPLAKEEDWLVSSDMEVEDVAWETGKIKAERISEKVHRGEDLVLKGEVLAVGVELKGLPAMDLSASFRRERLGESDSRIVVEEAVSYLGEASASVSGTLRESDLLVENGALILAPSPLSALKALEPGLERMEGEISGEAFFRGQVEDPSTYEASGQLRGTGLRASRRDEYTSLSMAISLADSQLRVDEGRVSHCDDELNFVLLTRSLLPLEAVFTRLDGHVAGFPFEATEMPEIVIEEARARLKPSRFQVLGGKVELAAERDAPGEISAHADAEELRLSNVLSSYLPAMGPEGVVSFRALLLGSTRGGELRPQVEVEVSLRDGALTVGGKRLKGLEAEARVSAGSDLLRLKELRIARGADKLEVSASAPLEWTASPIVTAPLEANFRMDLAEVADLPIPQGQFRDVGGRVMAEGSFRVPWPGGRDSLRFADLDALVKVTDGKLKLYGDVPPLLNIQGTLAVKSDRVLVRSLTGRIWDADFQISGGAGVSPPWAKRAGIRDVDLALSARSALLFRRPDLRLRGDINLRWTGPWEQSLLQGELKITRAYYLHDISVTPSRGARLPLQLFSLKGAPLESMRLSVKVKSDRGVTIKNNHVSTRATADLLLSGTGSEPMLTGVLSTDEGTVSFGNARLELKSSMVEFLPSDPLNPRLQVVMGDTVRGYVVTITVTGTLDAPEVLMDSSPPLEREKILVLVTTGLTLDEIEKQGVDRVAATQAALYVGKKVARYFSRGDPTERSFMDRFSIETESARSSRYEDPIRLEYLLKENVLLKKDELFLQGERDTYGDYNLSAGIRFELD